MEYRAAERKVKVADAEEHKAIFTEEVNNSFTYDKVAKETAVQHFTEVIDTDAVVEEILMKRPLELLLFCILRILLKKVVLVLRRKSLKMIKKYLTLLMLF